MKMLQRVLAESFPKIDHPFALDSTASSETDGESSVHSTQMDIPIKHMGNAESIDSIL